MSYLQTTEETEEIIKLKQLIEEKGNESNGDNKTGSNI